MAEQRSDPRARKIGEQLMGLLDDGETVVVRYEGAEMRVYAGDEDSTKHISSRLHHEQPELYGHLLRVQERLARAGRFLKKLIWFLAILVVLGLVSGFLDDLTGADLSGFRSFVAYVLVLTAAGFVAHFVGSFFERVRYALLRSDLHQAVEDSGLELDTVLAWTAHDGEIADAVKRLRGDDPVSSPRRF